MTQTNTPGRAVHQFCIQCVGGSPFEVQDCGGDHCLNGGSFPNGECWFYEYRMGRGRVSVKLVRAYCLFCQGNQVVFVRECAEQSCALRQFRLGTNPNRAGIAGNPAWKRAVNSDFEG